MGKNLRPYLSAVLAGIVCLALIYQDDQGALALFWNVGVVLALVMGAFAGAIHARFGAIARMTVVCILFLVLAVTAASYIHSLLFLFCLALICTVVIEGLAWMFQRVVRSQ